MWREEYSPPQHTSSVPNNTTPAATTIIWSPHTTSPIRPLLPASPIYYIGRNCQAHKQTHRQAVHNTGCAHIITQTQAVQCTTQREHTGCTIHNISQTCWLCNVYKRVGGFLKLKMDTWCTLLRRIVLRPPFPKSVFFSFCVFTRRPTPEEKIRLLCYNATLSQKLT